MSRHNYPDHERPFGPSPTGGDSHSRSSYSEQGASSNDVPADPHSNSTLFASFEAASNNSPNTHPASQRSTPVPYEPPYYLPAQQQLTPVSYPIYPSYQQFSEARCHGSRTHGGSYDRASSSSSTANPSHADLWISRTSSDFRSPHPVYSPASSFLQYQSTTSFAHPAEHSPSGSREAVPTITAANTQYQRPMGMNHASLDCIAPTRGDAQLPNARVHTAPSPVPYDVPPVTSELTIKKKRKRANARQLEALNEVYTRTASPSKEERQQLARDLDMPASSVQIWFKNKRQASRRGGRNPAYPPIRQVAVIPVSVVIAAFAILTVFVAARSLGGVTA